MLLSVVVPAYNEAPTITQALERLAKVELPCESEIIVVDDGSTDGTWEAASAVGDPRIRLLRHDHNRGKGAAVASAAGAAQGDYLLIQDADLEYDPGDIPRLLEPVANGEAEVVYGVRWFGSHNSYSYVYVLGNKAVTLAVNVLFNVYLSDVATCYKLVPMDLYRSLDLACNGFDMEAELTAKILRKKKVIYEVPISYSARSREAGKKLKAHDGLRSLGAILGVRLLGEPVRFRLGLGK